eukprot:5914459-Pyramimonas_sp.AAC.1
MALDDAKRAKLSCVRSTRRAARSCVDRSRNFVLAPFFRANCLKFVCEQRAYATQRDGWNVCVRHFQVTSRSGLVDYF